MPAIERFRARNSDQPDRAVTTLKDRTALRAALDSVEANIFIADLELRLVYLNRAAESTVAGLDEQLRGAFRVGVNELLGGSIHRFHKDPSRVEGILQQPGALPHTAVFGFGGITLSTRINGIRDDEGRLHGYVVAWEDVTEKRKVEELARAVAASVTAAAGSLEDLATGLRDDADEAAGQASSVASATEELSTSTVEIASSASAASSGATAAVSVAEDAAAIVERLADSSAKVADIVTMIRSIAEQTNLLALNATIESARAGEAGKGFAVVAGEVKELSRATATATTHIASLIAALQAEGTAAAEALRSLRSHIGDINDRQSMIAAAVEEQSATCREVTVNIQSVAAASGRTTTAVSSIHDSVVELRSKAAQLGDLVGATM